MKHIIFACGLALCFPLLDAAVVPGVRYPELLPEAQIMPRPASRAQWLWYAMRGRGGDSRNDFFRTWVTLDEAVKRAAVNVIFEGGVLYVNGREVPRLPDARIPRPVPVYSYDLTAFLKPGRNLIAVGRPDGVAFGNCRPMMMHGEIELVSGRKIPLDSLPGVFRIGRNRKGWQQPDFDESQLPTAQSLGDVLSPPEYLRSFAVECMTAPEEYERYSAALARSLVLPPGLEAEPEADAEVVLHGGIPGIRVAGGKILPPVLLIMKTAGTDTYDDMILRAYGAGVRMFQLAVDFGDLPGDPETGKYDYTGIDRYVRRVLNLAPEAHIMLCVLFRGGWQQRLLEKYPDEAVGYASRPGKFYDDDIKASRRISFASRIRREKIRAAIEDLGGYVRRQVWRKRIFGIRLAGGVYTEWGCFGMANDMPDTGAAMTGAFRAYLKRIYRSDAALRKAWHDPRVTLETALPPGYEERVGTGNYLKNHDSVDRRQIDFVQCMCRERDACLIDMVRAAKSAFPGAIAGAYYGYLCTPAYPPSSSDPERILTEGGADFFSRPYNYDGKTRLAGGSGLHAHVQSLCRRYGKMTFIEADIRTHLIFASKNWRCRSPEETRAVVARDLGNMIASGAGIQFYAVNDHFEYPAYSYSSEECIEPIAAAVRVWKEAFDRHVEVQRASVAVVCDLKTRFNGMPTVRTAEVSSAPWIWDSYRALAYAGRMFDMVDLKSFLLSSHRYNLVIFPEAFTLDARTRAALREKLDRPDTAALWIYAPGLNDPEHGFLEANMFETTGIRLKCYPADRRRPLEMTAGGMRFWHRNYNSGEAWSERVRVYADDPDAAVVGKWTDDQRPSFVLKRLPGGGISIFSGTAVTGTGRWMMIFDALGIPALADGETYVCANRRYLNIPLAENQSTTVTLPRKCFIRDVWTNQVLAMYGDTVKLTAAKPRTWLLEMSEPLDLGVKLDPLPVIVSRFSGVRPPDSRGVRSFHRAKDWQSTIPFAGEEGILGVRTDNKEILGTRFPVDPRKKYLLSGKFRVAGVPGNRLEHFYFGFAPYAADGRPIGPEMIRPVGTGIFPLAEKVEVGDRDLLIRAADWRIGTPHLRIAFDAKADLSDLPNFFLSPRIRKDSQTKGPDGTLRVTLSEPMKFARPAGTPVRLHSADAMHIYNAGKGAVLTDRWQTLEGVVSGEAVSGAVRDRWWHGTVSAAPVFRFAGKPLEGGRIEFREITVTEIP